MARKLTKEEIANGVFIDGAQLEKISDDVVETYNSLKLNSIDKKYQITQVCLTDGYTTATPSSKENVWFRSSQTGNNIAAPTYPLVAGQQVQNDFRLKGYYDTIGNFSPVSEANKWLFWQNGLFFNKPVIILNWTVFVQGPDSQYSFDGEAGAGLQAESGIRCNIQVKNFFEQRDRRYDELLLNNDVSLAREKFYGSFITSPAALSTELDRFPVPPAQVTGWFIENHLNISLPEQSQVNFTISLPNDRGIAPWTAEGAQNTKFCSTITFLEEIE